MNTVSGEKRAPRIRLCPRCKAETLPRQLRSSSLARNALRKAADGMVKTESPDPAASRIRAKKARKAERAALRQSVKRDGIVAAAKFFLAGQASPPPSEECADCMALQSRASARERSRAPLAA